MKHKWHKEIVAWADGEVIESKSLISPIGITPDWEEDNSPRWDNVYYEFRIKPQPKEPNHTLSCGCKSDYHGFPCEWDSGEGGISYGVLCEKHYWEWEAQPSWDCKEVSDDKPKEPQYLYVYEDDLFIEDSYQNEGAFFAQYKLPKKLNYKYIGKIKLETEDE